MMQVFAVFLILVLAPLNSGGNLNVVFKAPFKSIKECKAYVKKIGIKENERKMFADHNMQIGFYTCEKVRVIFHNKTKEKKEKKIKKVI